jgi:hypothetical protein
MDATTRQRIALKSPFNPPDLRPRCEACLRLLSHADYVSYWDGCPDLRRENAVPRLCETCCDEAEVKQS